VGAGSVLFQAVGRSPPVPAALAQAKETSRAHPGGPNVGRDARQDEFCQSLKSKRQFHEKGLAFFIGHADAPQADRFAR